jgi:ribosomal-protein-alanine N-acetyltransferase
MLADDLDAIVDIAQKSGLAVQVEDELRRDFTRAWVARDPPDAAPIAFLIAWLVADELQVLHVATRPDTRRRGAARQLLDALLDLGREQHCRVIVLEVRRSNHPAIRLYRSVGFRAIGLRKRYYADNGEDAVDMMLNLDTEGNVVRLPDEVLLGEPT